jgi:hypothetical protein
VNTAGGHRTNWQENIWDLTIYADGRSGWILQAVGVDEKKNLLEFNEKMLKSEAESNSILAPYIYDPSNGIVSAGDIFRVNTRE